MTSKNKGEAHLASGAKTVEEEAKIKENFKKRDERVLIKKVSHISIVVKDVYEALAAFDKLFDFVQNVRVASLPEQGVKVAIISLEGAEIEFVQPIRSGTGVARFLDRHGEGLHHISFEVSNIKDTLRSVGSRGALLIDKEPWHGIRGNSGFIHPSSLKGVLVELVEPESAKTK